MREVIVFLFFSFLFVNVFVVCCRRRLRIADLNLNNDFYTLLTVFVSYLFLVSYNNSRSATIGEFSTVTVR